MVYSASTHWFSWLPGEAREQDFPRKLGVQPDALVPPPELVVRFLSHAAWTPGTCSVLLRREAFAAVGGFEEQFRVLFEDQAFFYKVCSLAPVYVQSGTWDLYRQHDDSWCQTAGRDGEWSGRPPNPSHRAFVGWLEGWLADAGVVDQAVRRALDRELRAYRHPLHYRVDRRLARLRRV